ncbi:MAG: type IX secretion system outer membrane channel protein PorV [Rhodothermales bacterium]|nr:type IX secretion system outer membrane channel protein PorV [Rhodothermales bacterium]MBO6780587.1 type IX secretion system outer membrane channel protein PorV [Rhodothermales bacterium]
MSFLKHTAAKRPFPVRLTLLAVALVLSAGVLAGTAAAQVGGSAVVFLKIEPDSRAAGMGNAGVALADNASAIFWNPAGLAFQEGTEAAITHSNWLPEFNAGLFYEYLTAKHHVPGWGTFGAHLTYLFLGEHEGRDAQNNPTGTFKSYDLALGASYGVKLTERFGLGTSLRFIYSNLAPGQVVGAQETKAGVSTSFDLAGLYRTRKFNMGSTKGQLSLGFNLANMGPKIQYSDNDQADPIPTNLRLGYAFTMDFDEYNSLTLVTDFNKDLIHYSDSDSTGREADPFYKAIFSSWSPIEVQTNALNESQAELETLGVLDQMTIGAGLEYWYNNLFAIRGGYFYENPYNGNRKFMTLGSGVRYNIIGIDFSYIYALEENSPLANTMRFSLLINFGR